MIYNNNMTTILYQLRTNQYLLINSIDTRYSVQFHDGCLKFKLDPNNRSQKSPGRGTMYIHSLKYPSKYKTFLYGSLI